MLSVIKREERLTWPWFDMQTIDQSVALEHGLRDNRIETLIMIPIDDMHLLSAKRRDNIDTGLDRSIGNTSLEGLIMDCDSRPPIISPSDERCINEVGDADKASDKAIGRSLISLGGWRMLVDLPVVHHHNLVGHDQRLPLIVGDIDGRHPEFLLDASKLKLHVFTEFTIKRSKRFIKKEKIRLEYESSGDRNPLLLAARELLDPTLPEA